MRPLKRPILFAAIAFSLAIANMANAAVFETKFGVGCYKEFSIRGEIEAGDLGKFGVFLEREKKSLFSTTTKKPCAKLIVGYIHLDSNGGDVRTALSLGYEIRKMEVSTQVHQGGRCLSSCVFLLAAGVARVVPEKEKTYWGERVVEYQESRVGIHSPFFSALDPSTPLDQVRLRRQAMLDAIKQYLRDMDIPETLLEKMLSIPPESIQYLTREELKHFRLIGVDPSTAEIYVAKEASLYGLTSGVFRQRRSRVPDVCNYKYETNAEYTICEYAVLFNVTFEEMKRRHDRALRNCKPHDEACQIKRMRE